MKEIYLEILPDDYKNLFANKLYNDVINNNEVFSSKTIKHTLNYFESIEEYEKCKQLQNILNN
jgi:hypothetical protein